MGIQCERRWRKTNNIEMNKKVPPLFGCEGEEQATKQRQRQNHAPHVVRGPVVRDGHVPQVVQQVKDACTTSKGRGMVSGVKNKKERRKNKGGKEERRKEKRNKKEERKKERKKKEERRNKRKRKDAFSVARLRSNRTKRTRNRAEQ
jgi:hypothetical protein